MNPDSENKFNNRNPKSDAHEWTSGFGLEGQPSEDPTAQDPDLSEVNLNSPEMEDLQDLVRLYRQNGPPEPSEAAWSKLLAGVMAKTSAPDAKPARAATLLREMKERKSRRNWLRPIYGGAAAAAVLLAFMTYPRNKNQENLVEHPGKANLEKPIKPENHQRIDLAALGSDVPITNSSDFTLVSMRASDSELLLVGQPLITEPLVLVGMNDVDLESMKPDDEDYVPVFQKKTGSPMIIFPDASRRKPTEK
jgi:hypothetical protein